MRIDISLSDQAALFEADFTTVFPDWDTPETTFARIKYPDGNWIYHSDIIRTAFTMWRVGMGFRKP